MGQKYFSSMYCAKKGRKCKHLQGVLTRIGQGYSELAGTPCIRKEMYSYTELKKEVMGIHFWDVFNYILLL